MENTNLEVDILNFFYNLRDDKKITGIINIINGNSNKCSLRYLDQYVSDIANNVINQSYREHLRKYKKIYFDPFKRAKRITFKFYDSRYLETSYGQLNFFRWLLSNNFLMEFIE